MKVEYCIGCADDNCLPCIREERTNLRAENERLRALYHRAAEAFQRKYPGHEPLANVLRMAADAEQLQARIETLETLLADALLALKNQAPDFNSAGEVKADE